MKLSGPAAEEAAKVVEELFADLDDLRRLASTHGYYDADNIGQRTDVTTARVTLLNVLSSATEGDLMGTDMTEDDAKELFLSLHTNSVLGYDRGDCHCDHCDNALGELVLHFGVNRPESGVYSPANLVRQEAEKRGWLVGVPA